MPLSHIKDTEHSTDIYHAVCKLAMCVSRQGRQYCWYGTGGLTPLEEVLPNDEMHRMASQSACVHDQFGFPRTKKVRAFGFFTYLMLQNGFSPIETQKPRQMEGAKNWILRSFLSSRCFCRCISCTRYVSPVWRQRGSTQHQQHANFLVLTGLH